MHFFTNSPSVKHFPEAAIFLEIWKLTFVAFALSLSNTLKNCCSLPRLFMRLAALRLFSFRSNLAIVGCWVSKCRLKLYSSGTAAVSRHTTQIILSLFVVLCLFCFLFFVYFLHLFILFTCFVHLFCSFVYFSSFVLCLFCLSTQELNALCSPIFLFFPSRHG